MSPQSASKCQPHTNSNTRGAIGQSNKAANERFRPSDDGFFWQRKLCRSLGICRPRKVFSAHSLDRPGPITKRSCDFPAIGPQGKNSVCLGDLVGPLAGKNEGSDAIGDLDGCGSGQPFDMPFSFATPSVLALRASGSTYRVESRSTFPRGEALPAAKNLRFVRIFASLPVARTILVKGSVAVGEGLRPFFRPQSPHFETLGRSQFGSANPSGHVGTRQAPFRKGETSTPAHHV